MPLFFNPLAPKGGISKDIYLLQAPPWGWGAKKFGFSLEHNNYNNTTILLTGGATNVKLKKEKL